MPSARSLQLAAQAWCGAATQHKVMDPELAEAFAMILDSELSPIKAAFDTLRQAMQDDPMYAWSWHCNIAMAAYDEGMEHKASNRAAHRFMRNCFGVDTKEPT